MAMGAPPPRGVGPKDERFPRRERLRKRADYLRCYRTGRRRNGALLILYVAANTVGHPRMGITATRKTGDAVTRHRLKRWVRELYRRWPERDRLTAVDLVVHLKPEAGGAGHAALDHDLRRLLGEQERRGAGGGDRGARGRRETGV